MMLCINNYELHYIDECRARVQSQVAAYKNLIASSSDPTAIAAFEALYFNNMVLQLDYLFVHRSRTLEKKDGNPVNEVRIVCNSLLNNNGKMSEEKSIKLAPAKSVLKYQVGDEIKLNEADFLRLAEAYFAGIEHLYLALEPA
jgi:hypothetical protein